jgi:hypothetical protein
MRRFRERLLTSASVLVTACASDRAHSAATECASLSPAAATTLATGFDSIASVVALPSGTLLVADAAAPAVFALAPDGSRRAAVPRGGGPTEFTDVGPLLRLPPDSALLFDLSRRRFVVIGPAGFAVASRPWLPVAGANSLIGQPTPTVIDAGRRVYAYAIGDRLLRAHVTVTRCTLGVAWSCDTTARIPSAWLEPTRRPPSATAALVVGALTDRGVMGVTTEGVTVSVARDDHVARATHGDSSRTLDTLPRWPIAIDDAMWHEIVVAESSSAAALIADGLRTLVAGGGTIADVPLAMRTVRRAAQRPAYLPAFDRSPPLTGPNGTLWITRGHLPGGTHRVSIIGATGEHACVTVPANERLVGIDATHVYAARTTDIGESLIRYASPIPADGRASRTTAPLTRSRSP